MTVLFDPARHAPLDGAPWSEAAARAHMRSIVQDSLASFSPDGLWPVHPLDDTPGAPPNTGLYDGAAGVIWACRHLAAAGAIEPLQSFDHAPDFDVTVVTLTDRRHATAAEPVAVGETASFLIGDSGTLLLQWQQTGDAAVADRLHGVLRANRHNPTREALWGSPGSALAAVHMAESVDASGRPRWQALVRDAAQELVDTLEPDPETGAPIWMQDMYGRQQYLLGAGHGLVGNVYLALRGAALLPAPLQQQLLDTGLATLQATALHNGGCINWYPDSTPHAGRKKLPLVHDCHGAPGVLNRLASAPRTEAWDSLLRGAGNLVWRAGPLAKGPGLCHGTAGNALALLQLARRFGEPVWLERARAFAMHAVRQMEQQQVQFGRGRPSLWTGDLGVACVLWACVSGDDRLPVCDVF